jgi:hypothetical protein
LEIAQDGFMGKPERVSSTVLMLIIIAVASLIAVNPASAQSIPKPSVPEFSVKLVAHPYDVPPKTTTTIDQYTGKETTTTQPGYRVENKSIEVMIKNHRFTPYTNANGYELNLYYSVHVKGHFGEDWKDFCPTILAQLSSEYTVVSGSADYPDGSQLDFQVEAIIGHMYDVLAGRPILPLYELWPDATSGWSNTQTLTIEEGAFTTTITSNPPSVIPTPAPTVMSTPTATAAPTQNPPESSAQPITGTDMLFRLDWQGVAVVLLAIVVAVSIILIFFMRRKIRFLELKQDGI